MTLRVILALLLVGVASVGTAAVASAATRAENTFEDVRVRGTTNEGGTFRGRVDVLRFREQSGALVAIGELSGRLFDDQGDRVGRVNDERIRLPVTFDGGGSTVSQAACDVLELHLGPLDLDLLGLQVNLNEIVLTITAEPGPGNLLGDLLCAIAGLLDQGGLNQTLALLLNVVRQLVNLFG